MGSRVAASRFDIESPDPGSEETSARGIIGKCQALTTRVKARMKSTYGKTFFRRLNVALRSGWACLFAGVVLQFVQPATDWLAVPYFSLVICLNLVESSIGAVIHNLIGVVIGLAQALSVGAVCFLIFGTRLTLVPTIVIIFFSSFYVSYPTGVLGQEMARKVALALIGIIFTTGQSGINNDGMFFLVRLMGTTLFGAACALAAAIVPFPGLAFWEIRTSAKATVRGDAELFKSNCEAFCAREVSKLSSVFLHAKYLSKTACISLDEVNSRMGDVYWELHPLGLMPACKRLSGGLNVVKLHMMGMSMALQSGLILQYTPAEMSTNLRHSLTRLGERSKAMLELTVKMGRSKSVMVERERLLDKAREDLKMFDDSLKIAREQSYYVKKDDEPTLGDLVTIEQSQSRATEKCIKHLFQSMVPTYFFLFNLRMYFTEIMKMLNPNSTGKVANEMHKVAKHGGRVPMISMSHELDSNGQPIAVVVSAVADQASKTQKDPNKFSGLLGVAPTFRCQECEQKRKDEPCVEKEAWLSGCWKWITDTCQFNWQQAVRAAKFSLAMSIAALAGILYNERFAFWAVVTVGFIIQNHQGGCFRMANLRLQGTVIGAIYGYLMVVVLDNKSDYVLITLIPWVVLLSYLRFSKLFGPSGVLAGITAAIVMLGSDGAPVQELAVIRITENFIGVLALILVESLIFPDRAVILARKVLVSNLIDLRDCVKEVVSAYTGNYCDEHRKLVAAKIKKLEAGLRARLAEQRKLQEEAVNEPELWNGPFPAEIYAQLVQIQSRMLDLLHFMVLSFHAASEETLGSQIRKLVGPLQGSLNALEDEVWSSLHLLQGLLQCSRKCIDLMSTDSGFWHSRAAELRRAASRRDQNIHGAPNSDLEEMVGKVHPLLVLECNQRDIDGTPLSLKRRMDEFESSYEKVVGEFITQKKANPNAPILSNSAMLSFSALTFSLLSLLKETVELEKTVHQLLHFEHPWSVLEFWETVDQEMNSVPPSPRAFHRR